MRHRLFQKIFVPLVTLAVCIPLHTGTVSATGGQCLAQTVSVTLSSLNPTPYQLVGRLCWQGNLNGKTVQVLLHGLTYDHNYWDFPYQEPNYSYVSSAIQAGYAVLDMDRIGAGASDHPNDLNVSLTSGAYVTHQLVADLHAGVLADTSFDKVVLVGHSAGSGIAILEASAYHDVDGIILSGYAHLLNPLATPLIGTDFYPAQADAKFAGSDYSLGYLTTRPGTRSQLFYNMADADPNIIALDEQLKQAGTAEELADLPLTLLPTVSLTLQTPVLIADGQDDALLCGLLAPCTNAATMLAREQPFFSSDACLETFVLASAGHDINLHLNAWAWYNAANDWIARRVGTNAATPPTQPCES